jgi:tRNA (mo5U34)-methyltransferase
MIELSDQQLEEFNHTLPWEVAEMLPDGRILGKTGSLGARVTELDFRIAEIDARLGLSGKTVLELGSHEGYFTVQLAKRCKHVTAVEIRPSKVVCALVRNFVHDLHNVKLCLTDVRDVGADFGRFDIVVHLGVLYHLSNPVEHLYKIRDLSDNLLLCTQYCDETTAFQRSDIRFGNRSYRAHVYREHGWKDSWSGVESTSLWLYRDDVLALVRDVGYESCEVLKDWTASGHPRLTVLARRSRR